MAQVETRNGELLMKVRASQSEIIPWGTLEILRPISTGTFGEVYLAMYARKECAVKKYILNPKGEMTKEQLRNMERELNAYQTLDHPNIVKYIGTCLEYPQLALVTEYLPNGNVFDLLYTKQVNLPAATRLKLSNQLALVVCYMHSCDPVVVHRDLKTQNLVLDRDFNLKLCDFGKTKALEQGMLCLREDNGGSPRYMAPECFTVNGFITEKVDIWSLACCLIEILGGPIPYEDLPQTQQVIQRLLAESVPPTVPHWFTPVIRPCLQSCLELHPHRRPCVGEVQLALKAATPAELVAHGMDRRRTS
jgi:serine/threonine protein kinase